MASSSLALPTNLHGPSLAGMVLVPVVSGALKTVVGAALSGTVTDADARVGDVGAELDGGRAAALEGELDGGAWNTGGITA